MHTEKPSDLLELCEEVVDHVFDLRGFGGEQNQLLIGQVELQHIIRWNRHKQDVRVAGKEAVCKNQEVTEKEREVKSNHLIGHLTQISTENM